MKKILIGTTNPSKVTRFEALLAGYNVEFCTLKDLGIIKYDSQEENIMLGQYRERLIRFLAQALAL